MKLFILLALSFFLFPKNSCGIVVRHDTTEEKYIVKDRPDFLVDMPHEGHGVLIKSNWIVTVAHEIFYDYTGKLISISGNKYKIERVIIHPEYKKVPNELLKGSSIPLMDFNAKNNDIALIELTTPVINIEPIAMYTKFDEPGRVINIYGKGATGNGRTGQIFETKSQNKLRYCKNIVSGVKGNWLTYQFDAPDSAIELEGMHGSGDSGGPSVIYIGKSPFLVGLSAWQFIDGEMGALKEGLYGTTAYQVRISKYINWINSVITPANKTLH